MDPAQIDLTLFDLENMGSFDFGPCDADLGISYLPIAASTAQSPTDHFLSASESADMVLQASQGAVDTLAATISSSVNSGAISSTVTPIAETLTSNSRVSTLPASTMEPSLISREHCRPLRYHHHSTTVPVISHPEGANSSMVVASLSSSEFQAIVRQVSLTSTPDLLKTDIHSISGSLFPSSSSPSRAGHGSGGQCDPHGGFPPNSPTGLLYSQQHGQQLQQQQRQTIQQTLMKPQIQPQVLPEVQAQRCRNPQLHPLSIMRLQQLQQRQRDRANEASHQSDFGRHTTANKPQQLRNPQLMPHQLPGQESHQVCGPLSSLSFLPHSFQPYPYSHTHTHTHPQPYPYPYPTSQAFTQCPSRMVQHQEFWGRQTHLHHQDTQQQQQQQQRHLPPFPYPHPLADASFQSLASTATMNATHYMPPPPPPLHQHVYQSHMGQTQMGYFGGTFSTSDKGHRDLQMPSPLQQQQQQQFQTSLLGPIASSVSSPVTVTPPPGLVTPFHGHPYQYHNQCMLGPRDLISDPNSHSAITLGDQPHPQFMSYEKGPETTGNEQEDRDFEVHTPASATRNGRIMRAEELTKRLRRVREQRRTPSSPKPTPKQRQRRTQKRTQQQMQTPEDQDQDLVPIKQSDSPLLAAQTRILQTLSKITADDTAPISFSGSQIPSPSTTPRSSTSEGYLTTGVTSHLSPNDERGDMATRDLPGVLETEDASTSATEDSSMSANYVSLHDIEGAGLGHDDHHARSHSHNSYSTSSSSSGEESRTASPEPTYVDSEIKVYDDTVSQASKTLPKNSRGADYREFIGPVRVRRPKRSLAELYENGRRRSLGLSDDPEKDDVDIEGIAEVHPVHERLEKVEENELDDTESGGEADDSGSDYSERGPGPRRSRRQVQKRRTSDKDAARASSATFGLGTKKSTARVRSGAATGKRRLYRRQSSKTVQLSSAATSGSSFDASSMPQLHEKYTREMHSQVLRAQALVSGTPAPVADDDGVDVSPAGTSRDHANRHQPMDMEQTNKSGHHPNQSGSSGDIPCTFSSCPRTFVSQGLLKSHLVSHFEDKPFWCDECSEDGIHPRANLPPLVPGMQPQVFEVKRYKRNHDLLRHKREQHPPVSVQISRALDKITARELRREATLQKSRERTAGKKKEGEEEEEEEQEGQRRNPRKKGRRFEDESKELLAKIEASARAIETLESNQKAKKRRESVDQPNYQVDEKLIEDGASMQTEAPPTQRRVRKTKKE